MQLKRSRKKSGNAPIIPPEKLKLMIRYQSRICSLKHLKHHRLRKIHCLSSWRPRYGRRSWTWSVRCAWRRRRARSTRARSSTLSARAAGSRSSGPGRIVSSAELRIRRQGFLYFCLLTFKRWDILKWYLKLCIIVGVKRFVSWIMVNHLVLLDPDSYFISPI